MDSTRTSPVTCTAPRTLASSRGPNNAVSIGRKYIRACQISGGVPRMLLKAITPLSVRLPSIRSHSPSLSKAQTAIFWHSLYLPLPSNRVPRFRTSGIFQLYCLGNHPLSFILHHLLPGEGMLMSPSPNTSWPVLCLPATMRLPLTKVYHWSTDCGSSHSAGYLP